MLGQVRVQLGALRRMMNAGLVIKTRGPGLYDFTAEVARLVAARGGSGTVTLFVQHTSCSLIIQENADPQVQADLQAFFSRLVPPADDPSMAYLGHTYEGPDDMPAHIKAAILPVSITIPTFNGKLMLGNWQGIYLFEHRLAPQDRKVVVAFSGSDG